MAAPILIMTSFATELATPNVTDERTDILPRLIYKDSAKDMEKCLQLLLLKK